MLSIGQTGKLTFVDIVLYTIGTMAAVVLALLFHFSQAFYPDESLKANETLLMTDAMRHSLKASLLTNQGLSNYLTAVELKDSDAKLTQTKRSLQEAHRFISDYGFSDAATQVRVLEQIESTLNLVEAKGIHPSKADLIRLHQMQHHIDQLMGRYESNIWSVFKQKYLEFSTNTKQLKNFWVITFYVSLIFVFSFALLLWRQRETVREISAKDVELEKIAYFDNVTHTLNRHGIKEALNEQIALCQQKKERFYIAICDMDDFKNINDIFGHVAGDETLITLASRLQQSLGRHHVVGRLGGDEFIILFALGHDKRQIQPLLQEVLTAAVAPITYQNHQFNVSFSMGLAGYPIDAFNQVDLMKHADIALYEAKRKGKNRYDFFDQELSDKIQHNFQTEQGIKRALENDEFELYLQPIIDTDSNQVIAAEALTRWNHPQQGLVPPSEFMPLIEQGYYVNEFHDWLFQQIATVQQNWLGTHLEDTKLSINLAVMYMNKPNFVAEFPALLQRLNIDIHKVRFEITEFSLMKRNQQLSDEINQLVRMGFSFFLDDFGTGFSSISYLQKIEVSALKLDKTFLKLIPEKPSKNRTMLDTIITIAKDQQLALIAEGVEHDYQRRYLVEQQCTVHQGFLYAKPMPVATFEQTADVSRFLNSSYI